MVRHHHERIRCHAREPLRQSPPCLIHSQTGIAQYHGPIDNPAEQAYLDTMNEAEIKHLWADEAIRRDNELDEGSVQSFPAEEVLARVRKRIFA